jgi:phage terminase large subunit-like protein
MPRARTANFLNPDKHYLPNRMQEIFHSSDAMGRAIIAANKTGKTRGGVIEDWWTAIGRHPYRKAKAPNIGWIISQDHSQSRGSIRGYGKQKGDAPDQFAEFTRWLPLFGKYVADTNQQKRIITFKNGSVIEFKSSASGYEAFQSAKIDWAHFDEMPDEQVFDETMLRLVDRLGKWWLTATATEGIACWSFNKLWTPRGEPSEEKNAYGQPLYYFNTERDTLIINPTMYDNRSQQTGLLNISEKRIDHLKMIFSEARKMISVYGQYTAHEGLVFVDAWKPDDQIIDPIEIPANWHVYRGIDFGYSPQHPMVVVWLAHAPDDTWYLIDEWVGIGVTVKDAADHMKMDSHCQDINCTVVDPKGGERVDELIRCKINAIRGISDPQARYDKIHELLATGKLKVFRDKCPQFIDNMNKFSWPKHRNGISEPSKRPRLINNDSIDAVGYVLIQGFGTPEGPTIIKVSNQYEEERERFHKGIHEANEQYVEEHEEAYGWQ